jgi:hypothetical protein
MLEPTSLQMLVDILNHPLFGPYVKTLVIDTTHFLNDEEIEQVYFVVSGLPITLGGGKHLIRDKNTNVAIFQKRQLPAQKALANSQTTCFTSGAAQALLAEVMQKMNDCKELIIFDGAFFRGKMSLGHTKRWETVGMEPRIGRHHMCDDVTAMEASAFKPESFKVCSASDSYCCDSVRGENKPDVHNELDTVHLEAALQEYKAPFFLSSVQTLDLTLNLSLYSY